MTGRSSNPEVSGRRPTNTQARLRVLGLRSIGARTLSRPYALESVDEPLADRPVDGDAPKDASLGCQGVSVRKERDSARRSGDSPVVSEVGERHRGGTHQRPVRASDIDRVRRQMCSASSSRRNRSAIGGQSWKSSSCRVNRDSSRGTDWMVQWVATHGVPNRVLFELFDCVPSVTPSTRWTRTRRSGLCSGVRRAARGTGNPASGRRVVERRSRSRSRRSAACDRHPQVLVQELRRRRARAPQQLRKVAHADSEPCCEA